MGFHFVQHYLMREIKKVTVLGAGIMGTGIAAHLANMGCEVRLLDIVPPDEKDSTDVLVRNAFASNAIKKAMKAVKMPPFKDEETALGVEIGNLTDDLHKVVDSDWIIEAVVENLAIKRQLFERVDQYRTKGTLVSSNTSGIPIQLMAEGRSEDFRMHFCGTHFFNPVRYMRLLEVIPTKDTLPEIIDFHMEYGRIVLEKQTVLCKDTPGFIANRIGFFSGNLVTLLVEKYDLSIEEVDTLTGPAISRPKTGTFRLRDLTGVDLGVKFRNSMIENLLPYNDEFALKIKAQSLPPYWKFLVDNRFLGNKTGQGFYKKVIDEEGNKTFYALNLKTLEYHISKIPDLPSLEAAQTARSFGERMNALVNSKDKGGQFLAEYFAYFFAYMSNRVPEIADHLYSIDDALKAGFNWQYGAFETWDAMGLENGIRLSESYGFKVADWVKEMVANGNMEFYRKKITVWLCYNPATKRYEKVGNS